MKGCPECRKDKILRIIQVALIPAICAGLVWGGWWGSLAVIGAFGIVAIGIWRDMV